MQRAWNLVLQIGSLIQLPDSMRKFSKKKHDGLLLDDVRDFLFLSEHQEKLQGKYDAARARRANNMLLRTCARVRSCALARLRAFREV